MEGVGFVRADKIALAADVPPESDKRAQAAALYIRARGRKPQDKLLPAEELAARTAKLIGLVPDPAALAAARGLVDDEDSGRIYREGTLGKRAGRRRDAGTAPRRPAPPRP